MERPRAAENAQAEQSREAERDQELTRFERRLFLFDRLHLRLHAGRNFRHHVAERPASDEFDDGLVGRVPFSGQGPALPLGFRHGLASAKSPDRNKHDGEEGQEDRR